MKYDPQIHRRKSIRLKGYDYSQSGLYFITVCTNQRIHHFGKIINGEMILNDAGKIALQCWLAIPLHFPTAVLHQFVIMPNHIHGIIELSAGAKDFSTNNEIKTTSGNVAKDFSTNNEIKTTSGNVAKDFSPLRSPSKTIGSVVRGFKIGVTKWFRTNTHVKIVWQRNYYEHIIRDHRSYQTISEYIDQNPLKWTGDKFYSANNIDL